MDFSTNFKKADSVTETIIDVGKNEVLPLADTSKEVLSVDNMLTFTDSHIQDDYTARNKLIAVGSELERNLHTMSMKELLEYYRMLLKEREFHANCLFKAFNCVMRTDLAKQLLVGSKKEERILGITNKSEINKFSDLLKKSQLKKKQ